MPEFDVEKLYPGAVEVEVWDLRIDERVVVRVQTDEDNVVGTVTVDDIVRKGGVVVEVATLGEITLSPVALQGAVFYRLPLELPTEEGAVIRDPETADSIWRTGIRLAYSAWLLVARNGDNVVVSPEDIVAYKEELS